MNFDEFHFWSVSKLIFNARVACKIQVRNRPKMEFVEIQFSKIKCRSARGKKSQKAKYGS